MAKVGKTPPGGNGDSFAAPKPEGKKPVKNPSVRDISVGGKEIKGKNKGQLSFQKPKKPTTPTFGDGV